MNFLEKTGLQHFWGKIKTYVSTQTSSFWKEGKIYTCGDNTVQLDFQNMRDAKIYSRAGGTIKAGIVYHLHSDMPLRNKFSALYQDKSGNIQYPAVLEIIPYFGILLGTSKQTTVGYYLPTDGDYQTYVGRGKVIVGPTQSFASLLTTGKHVKLTRDGYRAVDVQGSVTIDDTWAKNNMNNIATCDATMVDAKVIDIDYDHKIATVRITIQDSEGQLYYVMTGRTIIGGTVSSMVDGEYYANVVLQVPYDSSGKVSLYNKYAITW